MDNHSPPETASGSSLEVIAAVDLTAGRGREEQRRFRLVDRDPDVDHVLDAERLLDEEHINSGTALLELLTTIHPNYSPYTYMRLMELYYRLKRREDYDWVCQRMCEQYSCEKVEWAETNEAFIANLDLTAQMFLFA